MSFPIQYECPICFGLTDMAGRMMGAKHRCTCPDRGTEATVKAWAERADLDPKELPNGRFQVAA